MVESYRDHNVVYKDQMHCKRILDSILDEEIIENDPSKMSSAMAYRMGCRETVHGKYPKTYWKGKRLHFYCCAAGSKKPKPDPKSDEKRERIEASHLCGNSHCIHPDHIIWEPQWKNHARIGCTCGYILKNETKLLNEFCECKPRCLTCFEIIEKNEVNSVGAWSPPSESSFFQDIWGDIKDFQSQNK